MNEFLDSRTAKEFLISRIVAEAERENVPLSQLEHKMLYFSETGWTLPDMMAVNEQFEKECNTATYEKKIARLIRNETRRLRKENPHELARWMHAIHRLRKEDHYILVMFDRAGISTGIVGDSWKSAILGLTIICLLIILAWLAHYVEWSTCGRGGLWYSYVSGNCTVTINEGLSRIVGYGYLGFVAFFVCGWVCVHFDPKRRIYSSLDRLFPHPHLRKQKDRNLTA